MTDTLELPQIRDQIQLKLPNVQMVVLFGSRARGKATEKSDWDIAILAAPGCYEGFEHLRLQGEIADILNVADEQVDLIDLRRCSPLLGYAIACEGKVLYEETTATFHRFQVKASKIYADTAKLRRLQRAYLGFEESFEGVQPNHDPA